ncbi:hypothetical protein DFH07DRAFT_943990 [Mycena maculata]|uniref:Uncharacterized protein n=1 Tax=Mycena maculata TaxID=230809 RepID=A0AAD7IAZ6_9AGAR|nr:hypothetical protein DFH07DRAFT_943990 [Mycena maculata]
MGSSTRFSLMNLVRSSPKYHCEKCQVTVHDIEQWLPHLGHDPVTESLVLKRMDSWVNEHPSPEEDPEDEAYFDKSDSNRSQRSDSYLPTMDQNGFDFKALRMNTAQPAPNNPPFSMLQRPTQNLRKPFSFIQTQSRNNAENTSQIPQSSRRQGDQPRMKQEQNDHNPIFPNPRHQQHTLIPQPRHETKTQSQSHKLRAFMTPTYDERSLQQPFSADPPQYSSSPKASSHKFRPESHSYTHPSASNQTQERTHSPVPRSRSPSVHFEPDFDAEDADLSQLMTKRMREAKLVKSKLAEERLATAALESRLCAQLAASGASELALKNRISELEAREALHQAKADEDARTAKAQAEEAERKLQDATAKLNDTNTRLDDIRAAAKNGLEEITSNYSALQAYLKDLKSDYNASQDVIKRMSAELSEIRRSAREGVKAVDTSENLGRNAETRALIDELQNDRTDAHQVIDMLRDKLHLLSAQVIEARERVAELEAIREGKIERVESKVEELADKLVKKEEEGARGLVDAVALEVRLNETNERLVKVSATLEQREIELGAFREQKVAWEWELKEKSTTLASLQSVAVDNADLKEHKFSLECQVKEMASRISVLQRVEAELMASEKEKTALECEVRESRPKVAALRTLETELKTAREEKVALECEVKEGRSGIAALRTLETELVTVRAEKVTLECEIKECQSKITTLRAAEAGLMTMKEKKVALECEVKETHSKLAGLEDLQRDTSAKLQQSKDRAHEQDVQLGQLRTELKAVESAKEELRSSLEASQQSAKNLTQEVHALTLRETVLQEKSNELAGQVSKLGAEVKKLSSEASAREEELRRGNNRNSVLQERFDSQALTLKLAKEQSGDLQERLLMSESAHATKLESATGKLNVEIAVLTEQKTGLQAALTRVTEEAATQQAGFLGASVDYENKLSKQEEMHAKLIQAESQRANAAEREAADTKRLADDLAQQIESGRADLEDAKKKAREAVSRDSLGMEGEVIVLRARLEELEGENSRLQHRARNLNKRYKDGDLSDSEKSFVNSLMQMSQSIHEQDIVAKENELRRRENMITSLQTRIDTLESTLARLLKERGKDSGPNSKSMVDLSLWMSSSPRSAQKQADAPPVASSSRIQPASPTVIVPDTPPVKKSAQVPAVKPPPLQTAHHAQTHKTFAAIDADDDPLTDSEDDVPKSATLGKRSRTPTSAKSDDEPSRPARRLRAVASRKPESTKKPVAEGVKSKQRKRR